MILKMTITEENTNRVSFPHRIADLPDDVLFILLDYCDIPTLGRLARVCRRFYHLSQQDCVWLRWKQRMTCVALECSEDCHTHRIGHRVTVRDQCRIARNWKGQKCKDMRAIHHNTKLQPWMQMVNQQLWISYAHAIHCYNISSSNAIRSQKKRQFTCLSEDPSRRAIAGSGDVCRFVVKDEIIVSGSSDGTLSSYRSHDGHLMSTYPRSHNGDIHCVDLSGGDTIISGSRDATLKIWRLNQRQSDALLHTLSAGDRVWSLATSPDSRSFISGTAGIHQRSPLQLWDLDKLQLLGHLGENYKHGAGVLDIKFDTRCTALTCGYDTFIRLWDLRLPLSKCVAEWEEPYDSALYCLQSDGNNAFVVGTARHGMVRLWDKRKKTSVQMYFVGRHVQSPVYSLAFNPLRLFVGVDVGIHVLNFN